MNDDESGDAGPGNLVDLIEGLIEPSEPAPISLVPVTWGWAALAMTVAVLLAWLVWRWSVRRRRNAYRRAALAELERATTVAEVAAILRRAALVAWPREEVAGVTGAEWIDFLERTAADGFGDTAGRELVSIPWRDETAPASPGLRHAVELWLRTHRANLQPVAADRPGKVAA